MSAAEFRTEVLHAVAVRSSLAPRGGRKSRPQAPVQKQKVGLGFGVLTFYSSSDEVASVTLSLARGAESSGG